MNGPADHSASGYRGTDERAGSTNLQKAFTVVGIVLMAELFLQFYLIATAAMHVWGSNDNARDVYAGFKLADTFASLHALNGTFTIPITILVLIALSFAAHLPRRAKAMSVALFALMVVQFLLPWLSGGNDLLVAVAGLHGLNAIVIVAVAGTLLGQNWAFRRRGTQPSAAA